jgi:hypothetical protein
MSVTPLESRVTIIVKALPQPSSGYGETVCCAGVTADGAWKRLYPIRFRHLSGDSAFKRWDWVDFKYRKPTRDARAESCHVYEDTIRRNGSLKRDDRGPFMNRVLRPSINDAIAAGSSLAVIRPTNTRFTYKRKSPTEIAKEKAAYEKAARQKSFLDEDLKALQPTPYEFRFAFEDDCKHSFTCGDWEAHAMFYRERTRTSETDALRWMDDTFNSKYPKAGMLFAVGNMAARPQTWQLLGVLRVEGLDQPAFI